MGAGYERYSFGRLIGNPTSLPGYLLSWSIGKTSGEMFNKPRPENPFLGGSWAPNPEEGRLIGGMRRISRGAASSGRHPLGEMFRQEDSAGQELQE